MELGTLERHKMGSGEIGGTAVEQDDRKEGRRDSTKRAEEEKR